MYIWLSYKRGATRFYRRFKTTKATKEYDVERITTRGLRRADSSHLISQRNIWSIIISPDELALEASWIWLVAFWQGHQHWISKNQGSTQPADIEFVEITIPSGRVPFEYVGNHKSLRSATFEVIAKYSQDIS